MEGDLWNLVRCILCIALFYLIISLFVLWCDYREKTAEARKAEKLVKERDRLVNKLNKQKYKPPPKEEVFNDDDPAEEIYVMSHGYNTQDDLNLDEPIHMSKISFLCQQCRNVQEPACKSFLTSDNGRCPGDYIVGDPVFKRLTTRYRKGVAK